MYRVSLLLIVLSLPVACRPYDGYRPVTDGAGLVPPDQAAQYGVEQAQAIAIGRALGAAYTGDRPADYARQVTASIEYALSLRDVRGVVPDTLGHRLTVTFASGWRTAVVPITDGVAPDATPGLPPRQ